MPTQAEIDAYHADGAVCLRGVAPNGSNACGMASPPT